jgi:hypothetical protein
MTRKGATLNGNSGNGVPGSVVVVVDDVVVVTMRRMSLDILRRIKKILWGKNAKNA